MSSQLLQACDCPSGLARRCDAACGCGSAGVGLAQLRDMRRTQEATMNCRATFLRYEPEVNECSGQYMDGEYPELQVCCGVILDNRREAQSVGLSEGGSVSRYRLRLPHWMAGKARPLSRYRIDQAHGRPLTRPLVLEQVGDAGVGPTAVVVRARSV